MRGLEKMRRGVSECAGKCMHSHQRLERVFTGRMQAQPTLVVKVFQADASC